MPPLDWCPASRYQGMRVWLSGDWRGWRRVSERLHGRSRPWVAVQHALGMLATVEHYLSPAWRRYPGFDGGRLPAYCLFRLGLFLHDIEPRKRAV